jgi:hypothetical protein
VDLATPPVVLNALHGSPAGTKHASDRRVSDVQLWQLRGRRLHGGVPFHGADRGSIDQVSEAARGRAARGLDELNSALKSILSNSRDGPFKVFQIHATMGLLAMYHRKFAEAADWFEPAVAESGDIGVPPWPARQL